MKNNYEIRGDHVAVFANGGGQVREILIDGVDFDKISAFRGAWYVWNDWNTFYARIKNSVKDGDSKGIQMHRAIMNPPSGLHVDHINHNGLDNRRNNLRIVTRGENMRNRRDSVAFQSNVDGLCWRPRNKTWEASVIVDGNSIYLGRIKDQIVAEAAVFMFKETGKHIKLSDSRRKSEFQSDVPGVYWHSKSNKWYVSTRYLGKRLHLGCFELKQEAEMAIIAFRETHQ